MGNYFDELRWKIIRANNGAFCNIFDLHKGIIGLENQKVLKPFLKYACITTTKQGDSDSEVICLVLALTVIELVLEGEHYAVKETLDRHSLLQTFLFTYVLHWSKDRIS